jgi:hypothetical protein
VNVRIDQILDDINAFTPRVRALLLASNLACSCPSVVTALGTRCCLARVCPRSCLPSLVSALVASAAARWLLSCSPVCPALRVESTCTTQRCWCCCSGRS